MDKYQRIKNNKRKIIEKQFKQKFELTIKELAQNLKVIDELCKEECNKNNKKG